MRSELYLNGTLVDLKEEIQCALTLMISDIREPKTRNGSFSKTVKLPATKTVNKLLGGIFDIAEDIQTSGVVNFVPDFNPNLKCEAILYADGLEQFRGNMKLTSIERDQHDHSLMWYNVVLFGEVANIYSAIGDAKMADLNLSAYNHTYNKAVQKATWTNTNYGTGYVYPMINYGGIPATDWAVENFYPSIYLKEYIDKIFLAAGKTYTSTFFNTDYFKHLIIPFCGEKLTITASQQAARLFSAYTSAQTSGVSAAVDPILFNTQTSDPSNQFDPTTGIFTVANSGYYSFYSSGVVTYDAISTVTGTGLSYFNIQVIVLRGATTYTYQLASDTLSTLSSYTSGQTIKVFTYQGWSQELLLLTGDTVRIKCAPSLLGLSGTVGQRIASNAKYFNRITNAQIVDGGSLDMASALPVDVKQADFLTSVLRLFNLYLEPDKTTPNNFFIDTDEDFYGTGSTRVWTDKVDSSKPILITPMGALDARRYRLKYAEDSDYWNKFYLDKWKESYGEKNLDITNDFLKNVMTNEIIFAPTPSIGDSSHDRIIPEIYQLGNSGVQTQMRSKLRILYWAGALNTVHPWNYNSTVAGTSVETTYPYCGHVDNPITPTKDLSFGVPREIYWVNPYGVTTYTNDNVYNRYHAKFLTEITDRNSKLVTLYVRLRPLDINRLSFRDLIFIDQHYYRLQKVLDYNPIAETVTKVELLKIKGAPSFTPYSKTLTFTYGEQFDNGDTVPTAGGNIGVGDVLDTSINTSTGMNNYVSRTSTGVSVSGSHIRVGNNCTNISVSDSSGVVIMGNLDNVCVINTNDITVTESDVTYMNGLRVQGSTDTHIFTTSQTITALGVWYGNSAVAPVTLTLDTSFFRTEDMITVQRIAAGSVVIDGNGVNINGAATKTLPSPLPVQASPP